MSIFSKVPETDLLPVEQGALTAAKIYGKRFLTLIIIAILAVLVTTIFLALYKNPTIGVGIFLGIATMYIGKLAAGKLRPLASFFAIEFDLLENTMEKILRTTEHENRVRIQRVYLKDLAYSLSELPAKDASHSIATTNSYWNNIVKLLEAQYNWDEHPNQEVKKQMLETLANSPINEEELVLYWKKLLDTTCAQFNKIDESKMEMKERIELKKILYGECLDITKPLLEKNLSSALMNTPLINIKIETKPPRNAYYYILQALKKAATTEEQVKIEVLTDSTDKEENNNQQTSNYNYRTA